MKRWILFVIAFVFFVGGVVLFCNFPHGKQKICTYEQTLFYDENEHVIDGKETICFYNYTDNALTSICLHLYPNAYRNGAKAKIVSLANYDKTYPNGKSYGGISIESVSHNEDYLTYEITGIDDNILKINIGELYPDDFFEFEVGFRVKLANVNHRLGYGENTINICNYYPVLCVYENGGYVTDLYDSNGDPFYSMISNYKVCITYSSEYTLASTGSQETTGEDGRLTTTIIADNVRDFAMVLSKKFDIINEKSDGVNLQYYYYNDQNSQSTMEVIKKVLNMNKKYGKYPYENLSVVQANFVHGGMEYPNIVLISDSLSDYDTYINVVVHELCHQWWYGVVGNNQYLFGFLDEGLTDYNTAKFYDVYPEYGHSSEEIFNNASKSYANFVKIYSDVKDDFSTSMARPLNEFDTESEYVYLSYTKGMLMFASLEKLVGTKGLDSCLKYYYECYKFKIATPDDLINCFNMASGKNLDSFFNSWINGDVVIGEF